MKNIKETRVIYIDFLKITEQLCLMIKGCTIVLIKHWADKHLKLVKNYCYGMM